MTDELPEVASRSAGAARTHVPVMVDRVVELLRATPDGPIVDLTLGAGGHAAAVVAARLDDLGHAHLVGVDRDPSALELARPVLAATGAEVHLAHARFDQLDDVLDAAGFGAVAGVLLDLGISSMHVDRPERGFSYANEGPLDMRMDPTSGAPVAELVNSATATELTRVITRFGEERFASRIAHAIVAARPLTTTTQLASVVRDAIPMAARRTGPHPATRTFQALRIAVNDELGALEACLPRALDRLAVGGVCVAIAYHSLEDRLVKRAFVESTTGCICPPGLPVCVCGRTPAFERLTRGAQRPAPDEVERNPRSRSARLRAVRRLPQTGTEQGSR